MANDETVEVLEGASFTFTCSTTNPTTIGLETTPAEFKDIINIGGTPQNRVYTIEDVQRGASSNSVSCNDGVTTVTFTIDVQCKHTSIIIYDNV